MPVTPVSTAEDSNEVYVLGSPESRAERVRRMQASVRALAREQIEAMCASMLELAQMAKEVAEGGDAYPVGVRELSGRIAHDLDAHARTIDVMLQRG